MPTYLEIAVNVPQVTGVFHYHLPPEMEGEVQSGHLVVVPFGRQIVQGVVLRQVDHPAVPRTRAVQALVDPQVVLTPSQLQLAVYLSESTLAPLTACINLLAPPGLSQQADLLYMPTEVVRDRAVADALPLLQGRLLRLLLRRGPLRGRQIDQAMPRLEWRRSAQALQRRGLVRSQSVLPPPSIQPKFVRTAQLACDPDAAEARIDELGRAGSAALSRRQAILRLLMGEPGPIEVSRIYAEISGNLSDLRRLATLGLVTLGESHIWRDPLEGLEYHPSAPPTLTQDQQAAWDAIQDGIRQSLSGQVTAPFLLHGVTGAGKTEIYLRAVESVLRAGRQAIVLVPEIALTPQTVRRFYARFRGRVGLIHSRLSAGERYDTWRRARAGELAVIIGPRSALFAPLKHLGVIVLDEFHDESYYQADPLPHYHAREAAIEYARLTRAVCLLGSATPDVASYQRALQGEWRLLQLPARILAHRETIQAQVTRLGFSSRYRPLQDQVEFMDLPPVQVVDMRQELKQGNRSIFSRALDLALTSVLSQGEQAILFLNRRGTASYVFCRDCGHTLRCPRCDLPLTYHRPEAGLTCHHCGYQRRMPDTCPNCRSKRIRHYGMGTEKVEEEVHARYPGVRTLRWDWDTTRQKGAHEAIWSRFAAHQADILIGTQMLAKGLDLPLVTLVGVVLADVGLGLPDYRAGERTFQVLAQVAGRAGRSPLGGQVILQTFQPAHYVIQAAARHDFMGFFDTELSHRRRLGYPPFNSLVRLEYRHTDPIQAEAEAHTLAREIQNWLAEEDKRATQLVGPAPAFYSRLGGQYRWQIILRGPDPVSLLRGRDFADWRIEVNPPSLL